MRVFWLVIKDLFQFVFGFSHITSNTAIALRSDILPIQPLAELIKSSSEVPSSDDVIILPERIVKEEVKVESLSEPTIMYVCEPGGALCLGSPYEEFDMVIDNFVYGTAVTVLSFKGRFARVWKSNNEGWILKDALTPDKNLVWPNLVSDTIYSFEVEETIKVRLLLGDVFFAGRFFLPLQAGEYILYRLLADNRQICWPAERPRTPGNWQQILRGVSGIHMSISPKADSIMEWIDEDGEGHLAYVGSVLSNNTLALATVSLTEPGTFNEFLMIETVWRELRPVFIDIV